MYRVRVRLNACTLTCSVRGRLYENYTKRKFITRNICDLRYQHLHDRMSYDKQILRSHLSLLQDDDSSKAIAPTNLVHDGLCLKKTIVYTHHSTFL